MKILLEAKSFWNAMGKRRSTAATIAEPINLRREIQIGVFSKMAHMGICFRGLPGHAQFLQKQNLFSSKILHIIDSWGPKVEPS